MILKIFKYGSKSFALKCKLTGNKGGENAVNYVMSTLDHKKNIRSVDPEVLMGDPELMKFHLSNGRFPHEYVSGVLTFTEPDIDDDTLRAISSDLTRMMFPGLKEHQIAHLIVKHKDKGKTEVHFIYGKEELTTGKKIDPYIIDRDFTKIDSWQNAINAEYNFNDPKNPINKRMIAEPEKDLPSQAKDIKTKINDTVEELINEGLIKDRKDLIQHIEAIEGVTEVSRVTSRNISVKVEDRKTPIRLKGKVFEESFNFDYLDITRLEKEAQDFANDREARAVREREKAKSIYEKQAEENRVKYKPHQGKLLQAEFYALVDDKIMSGDITKRKDIVELLKQQDKVVDVVDTHKHHISIYYEGGARPFRMSGEAYKREGNIDNYLKTLLDDKKDNDRILKERREEQEEFYHNKQFGNLNLKRMKDSRWDEFAKTLQEGQNIIEQFASKYDIIDQEDAVDSKLNLDTELSPFDLSIFEAYAEEPVMVDNKKNIENKKEKDNDRDNRNDREASERTDRIVRELITRNKKPRSIKQYIKGTIDGITGIFSGVRSKSKYDYRDIDRISQRVREIKEINRGNERRTRHTIEKSRNSNESFKSSNETLEQEIKRYRAKYGFDIDNNTTKTIDKIKISKFNRKSNIEMR
jgi:hypothetical protein